MRENLNALAQIVGGTIITAFGLGLLCWRLLLGHQWTLMESVFVFLCFWGGVPNVIFGVLAIARERSSKHAEQDRDDRQIDIAHQVVSGEAPRPPWGFIAVWILFLIFAIVGGLVQAVRYYLTGQGAEPSLPTLIGATLLLALIIWNWFPRRR
jgi:hypothetical protein